MMHMENRESQRMLPSQTFFGACDLSIDLWDCVLASLDTCINAEKLCEYRSLL